MRRNESRMQFSHVNDRNCSTAWKPSPTNRSSFEPRELVKHTVNGYGAKLRSCSQPGSYGVFRRIALRELLRAPSESSLAKYAHSSNEFQMTLHIRALANIPNSDDSLWPAGHTSDAREADYEGS